MYYKVIIELHIDPEDYDHMDEFDLEDIVSDELLAIMRTDLKSAYEVEEIEGEN